MLLESVEIGNDVRFAEDRKSTRLNSSHSQISYAVFCLKKKKINVAVLYTSEACNHLILTRMPFASPAFIDLSSLAQFFTNDRKPHLVATLTTSQIPLNR